MFFDTELALKQWLGQDNPAPPPPADYPFGVITIRNTVIRYVPDSLGIPETVIPENTGLVAFNSLPDEIDDHPWYDVGSGWVDSIDTEVIEDFIPPQPPVIPPPEPEDDIVIYTVTAEKTLARFVSGYNDAGKPIFMIYPKETAPAEDRDRFDTGDTVQVYPELIRGDGGGDYLEIVDPSVDATLYLLSSDGALS
jgi:hypothetical protein